MDRGKFSYKKFTSLMLTWCFLALVLTGMVMFVNPPGRIGETVVSLSIFFIFLLGSIAAIPPFSSVMEFSESIKNSWEPETNFAPSPHMELQSLEEVAETLGMSTDKAVAILSEEGVEVQAVQNTLKKIAAGSRTSPQQLYMTLDKAATPGRGTHGSSGEIQIPGLGRMTVVDVVNRLDLELDLVLEGLNERGVEAAAEARIRELAEENNLSPHELVKLMLE